MSGTAHQLADAVNLLERGVFDAHRREKAAAEELRARESLIDAAQAKESDVRQRVTALERQLEEARRAQRSTRALAARLDEQARKRWLEADSALARLEATLRAPESFATPASDHATESGKALKQARAMLLALFGPLGVAA